MGVYINGMEMPTEDEEIIIRIDSSGTVMTEYALPISGMKAIPVPPHGRLIDADALDPYILNEHYGYRLVYDEIDVAHAPTIIPAEEGD